MKNNKAAKKVNVPQRYRKRKQKNNSNFLKFIFKVIIKILILMLIIYTAFKYNIIPESYFTKFKKVDQIYNLKNIVDNNSNLKEQNNRNDTTIISNYNFEYKAWALDYSEDEKEDENNLDIISDEENETTYIMPVAGKIGSFFGTRTHPIKGSIEFHKGIDIEASSGTLIKSFLDGKVVFAGFEKTYGNYVKITHSDNFTTLYAHMSKIFVKKGQKVKKSEKIGSVGSTGNSNGPHLHFEVSKNGKLVDPLSIINE